jgi:hypothetical protein
VIVSDNSLVEHVALGVAAGVAATFLLQGIRTTEQKLLPETMPPIREDPGEFMVEQAEELLSEETREQLPTVVETVAAKSLALGYGMTAGAIYGALRPRAGNLLVDGTVLGLGVWAVGYLGWLPALGLMPPLQQQETEQVAGPIVQHVIFGVATVATYQWLHDLV